MEELEESEIRLQEIQACRSFLERFNNEEQESATDGGVDTLRESIFESTIAAEQPSPKFGEATTVPTPPAAPLVADDDFEAEVVDWAYQYLIGRNCPSALAAGLARNVLLEMKSMDLQYLRRNDVLDDQITQQGYDLHRLWEHVVKKVREVCESWAQEVSDEELAKNVLMNAKHEEVSTCAIKNGRRKMEDKHVVIKDLNTLFGLQGHPPSSFYAVFDGHAGTHAASYSAVHLHYNIVHHPSYPENIELAIKESFHKTDKNFINKSNREKLKSGSTALCCLFREKHLYVAWLGDSHAILVQGGRFHNMSIPHKPDREDERERIEGLGGMVTHYGTWRVNGVLAVSRAIGDVDYKPYVSCEADVRTWELDGTEDFLILACDGLWDVLQPENVVTLVYSYLAKHPGDMEGVSARLVQVAKEQKSGDNITVIVVFLRPVQSMADTIALYAATGSEAIVTPAIINNNSAGVGAPSPLPAINGNPFHSPLATDFGNVLFVEETPADLQRHQRRPFYVGAGRPSEIDVGGGGGGVGANYEETEVLQTPDFALNFSSAWDTVVLGGGPRPAANATPPPPPKEEGEEQQGQGGTDVPDNPFCLPAASNFQLPKEATGGNYFEGGFCESSDWKSKMDIEQQGFMEKALKSNLSPDAEPFVMLGHHQQQLESAAGLLQGFNEKGEEEKPLMPELMPEVPTAPPAESIAPAAPILVADFGSAATAAFSTPPMPALEAQQHPFLLTTEPENIYVDDMESAMRNMDVKDDPQKRDEKAEVDEEIEMQERQKFQDEYEQCFGFQVQQDIGNGEEEEEQQEGCCFPEEERDFEADRPPSELLQFGLQQTESEVLLLRGQQQEEEEYHRRPTLDLGDVGSIHDQPEPVTMDIAAMQEEAVPLEPLPISAEDNLFFDQLQQQPEPLFKQEDEVIVEASRDLIGPPMAAEPRAIDPQSLPSLDLVVEPVEKIPDGVPVAEDVEDDESEDGEEWKFYPNECKEGGGGGGAAEAQEEKSLGDHVVQVPPPEVAPVVVEKLVADGGAKGGAAAAPPKVPPPSKGVPKTKPQTGAAAKSTTAALQPTKPKVPMTTKSTTSTFSKTAVASTSSKPSTTNASKPAAASRVTSTKPSSAAAATKKPLQVSNVGNRATTTRSAPPLASAAQKPAAATTAARATSAVTAATKRTTATASSSTAVTMSKALLPRAATAKSTMNTTRTTLAGASRPTTTTAAPARRSAPAATTTTMATKVTKERSNVLAIRDRAAPAATAKRPMAARATAPSKVSSAAATKKASTTKSATNGTTKTMSSSSAAAAAATTSGIDAKQTKESVNKQISGSVRKSPLATRTSPVAAVNGTSSRLSPKGGHPADIIPPERKDFSPTKAMTSTPKKPTSGATTATSSSSPKLASSSMNRSTGLQNKATATTKSPSKAVSSSKTTPQATNRKSSASATPSSGTTKSPSSAASIKKQRQQQQQAMESPKHQLEEMSNEKGILDATSTKKEMLGGVGVDTIPVMRMMMTNGGGDVLLLGEPLIDDGESMMERPPAAAAPVVMQNGDGGGEDDHSAAISTTNGPPPPPSSSDAENMHNVMII